MVDPDGPWRPETTGREGWGVQGVDDRTEVANWTGEDRERGAGSEEQSSETK
jgi:hypothetical protein